MEKNNLKIFIQFSCLRVLIEGIENSLRNLSETELNG